MSEIRSLSAATSADTTPPELPDDRVDCWLVWLLDIPSHAEALSTSILSNDELQRADRFVFESHRRRYLSSHVALRLILAGYVSADPASLAIVAHHDGRPILRAPSGRVHFNLSHSGDVALMAVSRSAQVGVDIEVLREIPDFLAIARNHFANTEVEHLLRLPPELRLAGFYVTWTRKEAFVKALGLGLSYPLDAFCTGAPDRAPRLTGRGPALCREWTMVDLALPQRYRGAVAIQQPNVKVNFQEAEWGRLLENAH
jgi:4'-phosphopantetheinyl transferase